jgi:hypothetical protein
MIVILLSVGAVILWGVNVYMIYKSCNKRSSQIEMELREIERQFPRYYVKNVKV